MSARTRGSFALRVPISRWVWIVSWFCVWFVCLSLQAFVAVGDYNGHVGLGVKCSKEVATAIRGAIILAKLSVIPVRRGYWGNKIGKPHTVPCKVTWQVTAEWTCSVSSPACGHPSQIRLEMNNSDTKAIASDRLAYQTNLTLRAFNHCKSEFATFLTSLLNWLWLADLTWLIWTLH